MRRSIRLTPSASADLGYFLIHQQRSIVGAMREHLSIDADVESKRRKKLRPNRLAPWELRTGKFRVFYDIEEQHVVKIGAIGYKEHNELFIRGARVDL